VDKYLAGFDAQQPIDKIKGQGFISKNVDTIDNRPFFFFKYNFKNNSFLIKNWAQ